MGIFKRKKKKEAAVSAVATVEEQLTEEQDEVKPQPEKKKFGLGQIGEVVEVVKGVKSSFDEVYNTWIKPIVDNRAQIKRRWSALVTAISVVFFLLYVPILLFSKIAKGLSLGWDVALYICIGIYVVAVAVMVIITVASGKSTSTQTSKRRHKAATVMLFVVRIASLALSITAILVSGKGESTALDTILMVLAITSIVFTSLSLIFGGAVGFVKWLISPAKIRRKFSFVAFEWKQTLDEGKREKDKKTGKAYAKHSDRVAACLDKYLLPTFGKAYIDTVDKDKLLFLLGQLPQEDINLTEWTIKDLFEYAFNCGYVADNPCEGLELTGDIAKEKPQKRKREEGTGFFGMLASVFNKRGEKGTDSDVIEITDEEE